MTDNKVIFDIGMHKGEDTDFYLRKGYSVVGFEADPELVDHCKIRFRDALRTGSLTILEGAIAPKSAGQRITFFRSSHSVWGTANRDWVERNTKLGANAIELTVDRVDLIDAYKKFGIPFYVKIDIEGSDLYVLQTLETLPAKPRCLSIESEKLDFDRLLIEIKILEELGYNKFKAVQQQTIPNREVVVKTLDGNSYKHRFEHGSSGPFGDETPLPWITAAELIEEYRKIFELYEKFGDFSPFNSLPLDEKRKAAKQWAISTGHSGPLPGWYDTHATL
jgi:FkbM family methyltransferase